jgi:hypothetical protein
MSALAYIRSQVIPAALSMLPAKLDTPAARAMLVAIGLQESRFKYRRQIGGPARSFWQAESGGGFRGILFHAATRELARDVLQRTGYGEPDESDFAAIEHNDILACIGARLLLWTHPKALPGRGEAEAGWRYYIDTWRPGKPHRHTWDEFYKQAWEG